MHTGLGQTAKAKDLALVKIKADILDESRNRHVLNRKNDFI